MVGPRCFLLSLPKSSLQNREKTKGRNWTSFLNENAHVQLHLHSRCFSSHFFFLRLLPPLFFFFFFFKFIFKFFLDVNFFYGHDFYFLINLSDWLGGEEEK